MKAKRLLAGAMAAVMMGAVSAMGASAAQSVTITFDPNGVPAFKPIKVQIQKGTALYDEGNEFFENMVYMDGDLKKWTYGDKVIFEYFLDPQGEQWFAFNTYVFNEDTTVYAKWNDIIPSVSAVYNTDCAGMKAGSFLQTYITGYCADQAEYSKLDWKIYDERSGDKLDYSDILTEGNTYHVTLSFTEKPGFAFVEEKTKKFINGRALTGEHYWRDTIDFSFTPTKWKFGDVDRKDTEKGVTIKDLMMLVQLANGNKKLSDDAQFCAANCLWDDAINYRDVMLAIREYKNPGSVAK